MFSADFDPEFFDVQAGRGDPDPEPEPEPDEDHGPWIREGVIHTGRKPNH